MSQLGEIQLIINFSAPPESVEEGDRIFKSHAAFIAESHHRDGAKALLHYNLSKGPELSTPLDPSSAPTGNTQFTIAEVYDSEIGIQDHWEKAGGSWSKLGAMVEWSKNCTVTSVHRSPIMHSLW